MMLYAMDKLFNIFQGVGANDLYGQHIVAYEILAFASVHCTEWRSSTKKCCHTLGDAYPLVNLGDVDGLECLAWAIYDGVFVPGKPPRLTGHHDWAHIITRTTLCLIFHGKTMGGALPTLYQGILQCQVGHEDCATTGTSTAGQEEAQHCYSN